VQLLVQAKRPVLYVGGGCVDAAEEVREFVRRTKIPVVQTLMGLGTFPESDPLALHVGLASQNAPTEVSGAWWVLLLVGRRGWFAWKHVGAVWPYRKGGCYLKTAFGEPIVFLLYDFVSWCLETKRKGTMWGAYVCLRAYLCSFGSWFVPSMILLHIDMFCCFFSIRALIGDIRVA
jgi:Thiamine pyrophosphate enzyme, central domain